MVDTHRTGRNIKYTSSFTDKAADILMYMDFTWLCYHIFLVISMDWIFWDKNGDTADDIPTTSNNGQVENLYIRTSIL